MSRYLLLFLLILPFAIAGFMNSLVGYKLGRISRQRFVVQSVMWLAVVVGVASSKLIYEFLFRHDLTSTEPLSLFDVIQITGIVALVFAVNRTRSKLEQLEHRVKDLHQELSIRLSEERNKK